MQTSVCKWGNSASVRIPAAVLAETNLHIDDPITIRAERGKIVIEPVRSSKYNIGDLVAGITDDNRHGEIDFGEPVGKEVW
jgi:antitoxin MazE